MQKKKAWAVTRGQLTNDAVFGPAARRFADDQGQGGKAEKKS